MLIILSVSILIYEKKKFEYETFTNVGEYLRTFTC